MAGRPAPLSRAYEVPASGRVTRRFAWSTLGSTWARPVAIGALALFLGIGLLGLVYIFARPLALLFAAIVLAQALAPAVNRLARWLPRSAAIAVVYTVLLLVAGALMWVVAQNLAANLAPIFGNLPLLMVRLQEVLDSIVPAVGAALIGMIQDSISGFAPGLSELPLVVFQGIFEALLVIAVSAYWLVSSSRLYRFTISLLPRDRHQQVGDVLREMGETMGGYVRARILVAVVSGAMSYVALLVLAIPFPTALALIAGIGKLVPLIGGVLAAIPAIGVALLTSPAQTIAVAVVFVVIHQFASVVLLPGFTRGQANIPSVLALVALLVGGSEGGFLGMLIAIPLAGVVRVLILRVIVPEIRLRVRAKEGGTPREAPVAT